MNDTFITLIPKVKSTQIVGDFRLISLCNVTYKIEVKILANRLKKILPTIISPVQSAFVLSRYITDNILITYEALHSLTHRCNGSNRFMAIKLDMSKVYNRVEWEFLKAVMVQMEFNMQWIKLVMECMTTVSYSLLIMGEPQPIFKPTRSIRQGDPLSPYLFLICAEALFSLLFHAKRVGNISSVPIGSSPIKTSHIFFANNSLLFCKANSIKWSNMVSILNLYENASGQLLNKEKTSFFFSRNTPLMSNKT